MITDRAEEATDLATGERIFVNCHPDKVRKYLRERRYSPAWIGVYV